VSVISISRSAADRHSISLKSSFDVSTLVRPRVALRNARRALMSAPKNGAGRGSVSLQPAARKIGRDWPGERRRSYIAPFVASRSGGGSKVNVVRRNVVVEAVIVEQHLIVAAQPRRRSCRAGSRWVPAYLEQIGEIVREQDR